MLEFIIKPWHLITLFLASHLNRDVLVQHRRSIYDSKPYQSTSLTEGVKPQIGSLIIGIRAKILFEFAVLTIL